MNILKNKTAWLFLILSLLFGVSYQALDIHIQENGLLVEPFFLIPLAWLCLFISAFFFIKNFYKKKFPKKSTPKT
ncbi:Protein of unknown function [Halodesulfovibrio marinisediminis DSM 17456]|uniref:DUF3955 domain-containing protein n=2 Tax=Halodesulfovibrio marinisediminis TaxID=458711 RepID=A0A1N6I725_9BACT|nr:Protein of unknown function [Halodesulfovibrio marinisediminis DSM 17456]